MSDFTYLQHAEFQLALDPELPFGEAQLSALAGMLELQEGVKLNTLGGRNCVNIADVPGIGRVVARQYMRGGLLRFCIQSRYVRWGKTRGEHEFRMLEAARGAGVRVPDPLGFASRGSLLYEAWLFTREIPGTRSMAELARAEDEAVPALMDSVIAQVIMLIRQRIFHVDLHPGNVLVDEGKQVYVIDFDKASYFSGSLNALRDLYLCRWRRAVIKHELPEILSELMSHGLRLSFE